MTLEERPIRVPTYITNAEDELSQYFTDLNKDCRLTFEAFDELVIVSKEELKDVKKLYINIGDKYGKCLKQVTEKIVSLEHEKELLIKDVSNGQKIHELNMINEKQMYELNIEKLNQNMMNEKHMYISSIEKLNQHIININIDMENEKLKYELNIEKLNQIIFNDKKIFDLSIEKLNQDIQYKTYMSIKEVEYLNKDIDRLNQNIKKLDEEIINIKLSFEKDIVMLKNAMNLYSIVDLMLIFSILKYVKTLLDVSVLNLLFFKNISRCFCFDTSS